MYRSQEDEPSKAHSPSLLPSLDTSSEGNDECVICSENPREIMFNPCGHAVCCEQCGMIVKKCLLCKLPVSSRTKVSSNSSILIMRWVCT